MNQTQRWKRFITWWDMTFPAGLNLDECTPYEVANMIEDKVFEIKTMGKNQEKSK